MRAHDIVVNDIPKHLSSSSTHFILAKDEKLSIPLKLKGVISYLDVRTPLLYETETCPHISLTSDKEWNP
jgi:hypothetical protein